MEVCGNDNSSVSDAGVVHRQVFDVGLVQRRLHSSDRSVQSR